MNTLVAPPHRVPSKPYTPKKLEKAKNMTVVVGFPYRDGVILAADSQATYPTGLKYTDHKVFSMEGLPVPCAFASAGEAGLGLEIRDKIGEKIRSLPSDNISVTSIRESVDEVVDSFGRIYTNVGVEFLLGIGTSTGETVLLHFDGKSVNPTFDLKVLGCGNEPLLKFLERKMYREDLPKEEAIMLAGYMVKQAAMYVTGCGLPVEGFLVKVGGVENVDEWLRIGGDLVENQMDSDLRETLTKSF